MAPIVAIIMQQSSSHYRHHHTALIIVTIIEVFHHLVKIICKSLSKPTPFTRFYCTIVEASLYLACSSNCMRSVVHCPIVTSGYCPILLHCRSTLPNCPRVKQGNQASASICTFYLQSLSSSGSRQLSLDAGIWHI